MNFLQLPGVDVYTKGDRSVAEALLPLTHLGIGAHQDDLEIMAFHGIARCFRQGTQRFGGVVLTDGAGSPRSGNFASSLDAQMRDLRRAEQRCAARLGDYELVVQLGYPSADVRSRSHVGTSQALQEIFTHAKIDTVYMHSLFDKHPTHIAAALHTIAALRALPAKHHPRRLLGCEVWRDLDWVPDDEKIALELPPESLELWSALLGCFESQVAAGKRYDLAAPGRALAHSTFFQAREVDPSSSLWWAVDQTPLIQFKDLTPSDFVQSLVERFSGELQQTLEASALAVPNTDFP